MINIKAARAEPELFRAALDRRGAAQDFDALLEADVQWRKLTEVVQQLRAEQKKRSKGRPSPEDVAELQRIKAELQSAETSLGQAEQERDRLLISLPNLPAASAPDGGEEDSVVLREWGTIPEFDFTPRDHMEIRSPRGWIDTRRGARVAGSRFAYRFGDIALTEMALYRYVMDQVVRRGFMPVLPPVLVNENALFGTGYLPTEESNLYKLERDNLYLSGTSEVTLAGIHADERLDEAELPAFYTAFSTNFRREAGAAGRDTRGMLRQHQFDKVEMFAFCLPEQSEEIHERLLSYEEEFVQALGLPYRVLNIAIGDLGNPAAKKYDIEAWFPTQGKYREITSCSNTTDYQARRLNIRYQRGDERDFVHTVNGTGATARALLAILENFQDADGAVTVPEVLHAYGAPEYIGRQD
ncbi:serine--tRNA ligase [Streptomyces sp. TP-A0356]|uniref:serine--tRNA ligase n=1 Tax=Streptomyces sp. TP-A0356 TaxID=1359208 RepID=UPI0006E2D58F|nr:serine--tRNA ligase [Streptomyces sp. TP-A0356]